MAEQPSDETKIGRTADGHTVLMIPQGTNALVLTPEGVRALINGLAVTQGLRISIEGEMLPGNVVRLRGISR